ncbi:MAG: hypothetical protein IKQ70_09330 [Bacteroidales bacterium]|nr:hypothetical protein [Bacteroidales bacterium]
MSYTVNIEYDLSYKYPLISGYYTALDYHRNGSPKKSQWLISVDEEISCFVFAKQNDWISKEDHKGWGITDDCKVLGKTTANKETFIARFEEYDYNLDHWHGYPADLGRPQDIPADFVLLDWYKYKKYITKSQYSKIRRGIL